MQRLITVTELAKQLSVSETAVRKAIRSGRLTPYCKDGTPLPPETKIRPKFLRLREAKKQWVEGRYKPGPGKEPSSLLEARKRRIEIDTKLKEIELRRKNRELIPAEASTAAIKALGRATQRVHRSIVGWGEELCGAAHGGGLPAVSGLLRAKSVELSNAVADLLGAEARRVDGPGEPRGLGRRNGERLSLGGCGGQGGDIYFLRDLSDGRRQTWRERVAQNSGRKME
jgi:hypothetical protein